MFAGERREWIKPIMFSGGLGTIDAQLVQKEQPEAGMIVTKVGGPVYRIGVGGGAASSVEVQGMRFHDIRSLLKLIISSPPTPESFLCGRGV